MKISLLFIAMVLAVAVDAPAEFYKYKDSSGALVITDKLENVPQRYRKQFKVVWDADLEAKDPLAQARARAAASRSPERQEKPRQQQPGSLREKGTDGKRLVVTVDEATGEVIKRFE